LLEKSVGGTAALQDLAATFPPPLIHLAYHNISPPLGKQLVLELEARMSSTEGVDGFPRNLGRRHALPLYEDVPHTTAQAGAQNALRQRKQATVLEWGQWRRRCRRVAVERFENTHMKDIMNAGISRKAQAVGDRAHALENLEGTSVTWSKLAASSRH
jgi:hypothetical protein